ncbi:DUF4064 domain-containing protein [Planomicrobium sp. YIM 101495]|uniref:DUF4064 domain-containing protein n=1 Tax=Planomicrobium sp. YIM 101495 TaxID=2665160 RepID=UPI0012B7549B|nr:DUF4064 domain-containing protein [Planomicrobium sp. YIM 101495]MTD31551.1 DUF4064 domain-containing protein [Planomicrobium sp. YIM 101495]
MHERPISRVGEMVLGIVGIVFNIIAIILTLMIVLGVSGFEGTEEHNQIQQDLLNDPTFTDPQEAQMAMDMFNGILGFFGIFGWVFIAILIISTILAIVALASLKRNAKLSGVFFILAGVFAGILSLTSVLFYIAAIMCFVRKTPMREDELLRKADQDIQTQETPYRPF